MIDPQNLPLDEMSLASNVHPSTPRPSWRDLWIYEKEVHPAFRTIPDYHAALRFLVSPYSKLKDILGDWTKN